MHNETKGAVPTASINHSPNNVGGIMTPEKSRQLNLDLPIIQLAKGEKPYHTTTASLALINTITQGFKATYHVMARAQMDIDHGNDREEEYHKAYLDFVELYFEPLINLVKTRVQLNGLLENKGLDDNPFSEITLPITGDDILEERQAASDYAESITRPFLRACQGCSDDLNRLIDLMGTKNLITETRPIYERSADEINLICLKLGLEIHDLRSPITSISGFQQLYKRKSDYPTFKKYIDRIEGLGRYIANLTPTFVEGYQRENMSTNSIHQIIEDIASDSIILPLKDSGIIINPQPIKRTPYQETHDLNPEIPIAKGNRAKLEFEIQKIDNNDSIWNTVVDASPKLVAQIMENLLRNATKAQGFIGKDNSFRVIPDNFGKGKIDYDKNIPTIHVHFGLNDATSPKYFVIKVHDNGIPFENDTNRFENTGTNGYGGEDVNTSGVAMFHLQREIKNAGGSIKIENEKGRKSVQVYLPLAA